MGTSLLKPTSWSMSYEAYGREVGTSVSITSPFRRTSTVDSASESVNFICGMLLLFVLVIPLFRKTMSFSFDVNDYGFTSMLSWGRVLGSLDPTLRWIIREDFDRLKT